ncbi:MAG: hypothetical protein M1825_002127 [Sarcosagium campestre]|nr:MAG: hypothetical protein M1825_002127 [Sarcosagium campestre]
MPECKDNKADPFLCCPSELPICQSILGYGFGCFAPAAISQTTSTFSWSIGGVTRSLDSTSTSGAIHTSSHTTAETTSTSLSSDKVAATPASTTNLLCWDEDAAALLACGFGAKSTITTGDVSSSGCRVFATARSKDALADLEKLDGVETLSLDVTDPSSIHDAKVEVEQRTKGHLDILVNNAGRNYTMPALDVTFDEVQSTFDTNLFGVMRMCQAFIPLLIASQGTIVQLGSVAGIIPYVFGASYNASKAALHSYSNTLRLELAPYKVKVVILVTGGVRSRIARVERTLPEGSLYAPINDAYQNRLTHSQQNGIATDEYAKSVVDQILKPSPAKWIFEGGKSWVVWFLDSYGPRGIWDWLLPSQFGLVDLKKKVDVVQTRNKSD